jgi:hypothetical protein
MKGRRFLELAKEIVVGGTEVHWRGAVGRAYYALVLEGRDALRQWGFPSPARDKIHFFVRSRFSFPADADLKSIGLILDRFGRLRNEADYDMSALPAFLSGRRAQDAIQNVIQGIDLLDAIDADPMRRAAAIAAIKKAFP